MPVTFYEIDAETGDEIIAFTRRGETVIMLRDAYTKRFIRRLYGVVAEVTNVFEYPPYYAKRSNPLYVDVKVGTYIPVEHIQQYKEIVNKFKEGSFGIINEFFGPDIARQSRIAGVEYTHIEPYIEPEAIYPEYVYYAIWHHYKNDEKEEKGYGRL